MAMYMSKYKNSRLRNELCRGGGWGGGGGEISKRGRGGETFLGIWPRGWRNHAGGGGGTEIPRTPVVDVCTTAL